MAETAEKAQNFEEIITQEVNNLGLDVADLEETAAASKVSEVVGERAGENMPQGGGRSGTKDESSPAKRIISQTVTSLLFRSSPPQNLVLPTPSKQKTEVKKAIAKRTRDLVSQAIKLERSKHYSAAKMERLVAEIRQLQQLMSQLFSITVEHLEALYRKYVWRQ